MHIILYPVMVSNYDVMHIPEIATPFALLKASVIMNPIRLMITHSVYLKTDS